MISTAIGNHEFDNQLAVLESQMRMAAFPFLSANVTTREGEYIGKPYVIKDFNVFKVGIFGLTTRSTEIIGNPEIIGDLIFEDEVAAARKMVRQLEPQVDVIIALVHLGLYDDASQGSRRLANEVEGIDLIIDGHSHTKMSEPVYVKGTPIVQAWQWGLNIGKGILTITDGNVTAFSWEAVPVNLKNRVKKDDGTSVYPFIGEEIKEDEFLLSSLKPYEEMVEAVLSEVIGHAESTFFNKNVRKAETELGNMVADSRLWYTRNLNVDFAFQNGGGIRTDLPEGDIAKKVIYEVLPFDNSVVVVDLKGTDVIELFNFVATIKQGKGAFPQVSKGVSFTIDYNTQTCRDVLIGGKPIDPNKVYTIATNSYLASGGDGYKIFTKALKSYDSSFFQRDAFIDYIIDLGGRIKPELKGRIKVLGGSETSLNTDAAKEEEAA